jgi:hypothetical protein
MDFIDGEMFIFVNGVRIVLLFSFALTVGESFTVLQKAGRLVRRVNRMVIGLFFSVSGFTVL